MNETNKFDLILCELHYTPLHGKTDDSCPTIESHYIVNDRFNPLTGESTTIFDFVSESESEEDDSDSDSENDISDLQLCLEESNEFYQTINPITNIKYVPHTCIRNYFNIISRTDYIKPELALCITLPTGELIAIIKTIWIKLIQRAWKRVFIRRQEIVNGRRHIDSLNCRRVTGYWPAKYRVLPTLVGLLVN